MSKWLGFDLFLCLISEVISMDFSKDGFVCKIESVVSTVRGFVWSALRLSSSVQSPQNDSAQRYLGLGFKALIATPEKETLHQRDRSSRIVHSHTRASSSSSYSFRSLPKLSCSSSFSSSMTGDLIGTESGVYMGSNGEDLMTEMVDINGAPCNYLSRKKPCCRDTRTREHPAPISTLARPGNLSGDKPFALKRQCVEGRLIITKERRKQCHRVHAKKENGRLLLYLVPPVEDEEYGEEMEDVIEENHVKDIFDNHSDRKQPCRVVDATGMEKGPFTTVASSMHEACVVNWSGNGGAARRCFTYVGEGISDTIFFNVPTMNKAIYT